MVSELADPQAEAEASVWLARLRGPDRNADCEADFRAWLAEDPAHEAAFARATDLWDIIGGAGADLDRQAPGVAARRPVAAMATAALALAVLVGGGALLMRPPAYQTGVGEQQTVRLSDGTRLTLNTDSRVIVRFSRGQRRVMLQHGEAMFEVAKNPHRPFIVLASGEEVKALGTVFVVRKDAAEVKVTLVEGKVSVTAPGKAERRLVAVLAPGQRLTMRDQAAAAIDRPRLDAVTAWRHGQVMFDAVSLQEAAAELNRYGGPRILIGDPRLDRLKISGVFSTSDPEAFAAAASQLLGLSVRSDAHGMILEPGAARS